MRLRFACAGVRGRLRSPCWWRRGARGSRALVVLVALGAPLSDGTPDSSAWQRKIIGTWVLWRSSRAVDVQGGSLFEHNGNGSKP